MYICRLCNQSTPLNERMHRAVTAARPVHYSNGSVGAEIVSEVQACAPCAYSVEPKTHEPVTRESAPERRKKTDEERAGSEHGRR